MTAKDVAGVAREACPVKISYLSADIVNEQREELKSLLG
jgi:hypothetical protein